MKNNFICALLIGLLLQVVVTVFGVLALQTVGTTKVYTKVETVGNRKGFTKVEEKPLTRLNRWQGKR